MSRDVTVLSTRCNAMYGKALAGLLLACLLAGIFLAGAIEPGTWEVDASWSYGDFAMNVAAMVGADAVPRESYENALQALENAREELSRLEEDCRQLESQLEGSYSLLERRFRKLAEAYDNLLIEGGLEGHSLVVDQEDVLVNPSRYDLVRFLERNGVDENEYVATSYACSDFARDLQHHAHEAGFRSACVTLDFAESAGSAGHVMNAFETVDEGLLFVEPQNDEIFENLHVGGRYWGDEIVGIEFRWDG